MRLDCRIVLRALQSGLNCCDTRYVTLRRSLPNNLLPVRSYGVTMTGKTALALVAEGTEEMELVISVDVLRRAGISVTIASLHGTGPVKCSRDVRIQPDASLEGALAEGPYDVVVLPGGLGGASAFAESKLVGKLLKEQESSGRLIAAICAAPTALKAHGVCANKKVTFHPSQAEKMADGGNYVIVNDRVVVDGNLVTSQGPGTSFEFGLAIVTKLLDKDVATAISKPLILA